MSALTVGLIGWLTAPTFSQAAATPIQWMRLTPGMATVQQGQVVFVHQGETLTETAAFKTTQAIPHFNVNVALSNYAAHRGLALSVVSTSAPSTSLAAGQTVVVTLTVAAAPTAMVRDYVVNLHVNQLTGMSASGVPHDLDFTVRVEHALPAITWAPRGSVAATTVTAQENAVIELRKQHRLTETAVFTSSVPLYNAQIRAFVPDFVRDGGVQLVVVPPTTPTTIAANTPQVVRFTVHAGAGAKLGYYHVNLYIDAHLTPTGPLVRVSQDLVLRLDVVRK